MFFLYMFYTTLIILMKVNFGMIVLQSICHLNVSSMDKHFLLLFNFCEPLEYVFSIFVYSQIRRDTIRICVVLSCNVQRQYASSNCIFGQIDMDKINICVV